MNIYYIGNGFDLSHDLNTSYLDFKEYFKKNNEKYYNKFADLYGLRRIVGYDYDGDAEYEDDDEAIRQLWSDFENTLGKIDYGFIEAKFVERSMALDKTDSEFEGIFDPDLEWKKDIYIENMDLYELYKPLQETFISWVNSIEKTKCPSAPKHSPHPLYPIHNKNSLFIVFNYTHTLQKMYNIDDDNIIYPHGESNTMPIFGHGDKEIARKILKHEIEDADDRYILNWISEYLENTLKHVDSYLKDVEFFFNFNNISDENIIIKVIGCSFGKIDLQYFEQANNLFPLAKWEIGYFSEADFSRIIEFLRLNNMIEQRNKVKLICTNDDLYIRSELEIKAKEYGF